MISLNDLRQTLAQLIRSVEPDLRGIVFKRAYRNDALFVTDCCRRAQKKAAIKAALSARGFRIAEDRALLFIEPPLDFYCFKHAPYPTCPKEDALKPYYMLQEMLIKHETHFCDPYGARLFIKAMEADQTDEACRMLLTDIAAKLRRGEKLEGYLLPIISFYIESRCNAC